MTALYHAERELVRCLERGPLSEREARAVVEALAGEVRGAAARALDELELREEIVRRDGLVRLAGR